MTDGTISRALSSTPTLVLVGGQDKLLPSKEEGRRLKDLIGPNCTLITYNEGSHFLLDDQVNLTATILQSNLFRTSELDPIKDFTLPPPPLLLGLSTRKCARSASWPPPSSSPPPLLMT